MAAADHQVTSEAQTGLVRPAALDMGIIYVPYRARTNPYSRRAVESVRPVPTIPFWGMAYRQFMLVMLVEVALFTMFVLAGVLLRNDRRSIKRRCCSRP